MRRLLSLLLSSFLIVKNQQVKRKVEVQNAI